MAHPSFTYSPCFPPILSYLQSRSYWCTAQQSLQPMPVLCPVKVHRLTQCAVIKPHRKRCRSPGTSWETCCPCGVPEPRTLLLTPCLIFTSSLSSSLRERPTQLHCLPPAVPLAGLDSSPGAFLGRYCSSMGGSRPREQWSQCSLST